VTRDSRYLFQRNGNWWVKVAVPASLRSALGYDLRRSLRTRSLERARQARWPVVAEFRKRIDEARARQEDACRSSTAARTAPGSGDGFEIVRREDFSDVTFLLEIQPPGLARAAAPGQFVVVISHERGERIPLTIADFDRDAGTITLVVQAVGKTTREMQRNCRVGTRLFGVVGPLGIPSETRGISKVVCVGGGLGVAPIYPQLRAFKQSGAYVIGVVGFKSRDLMFWQEKLSKYSDELLVCTDDGSLGIRGLVTRGIEAALAAHSDVDRVVAIGPPIMMKACAETTRSHGVPTTVSLNPIMVDGTGMCGGCRVRVGDRVKFACVDGPEFDGHQVDFDDLMSRLRRFKLQERQALDAWNAEAEREATQG
jgi:NAD(P)H-flavin reductase